MGEVLANSRSQYAIRRHETKWGRARRRNARLGVFHRNKKCLRKFVEILKSFLSLQSLKKGSRCGAVGSAPGLGPGGRQFEPGHLDKKSLPFERLEGFFHLEMLRLL